MQEEKPASQPARSSAKPATASTKDKREVRRLVSDDPSFAVGSLGSTSENRANRLKRFGLPVYAQRREMRIFFVFYFVCTFL
jgi:hypothetical protein